MNVHSLVFRSSACLCYVQPCSLFAYHVLFLIFQGATIVDQRVCISGWGIYADESDPWSNSSWNYEINSMVCIAFLPKIIYPSTISYSFGCSILRKPFSQERQNFYFLAVHIILETNSGFDNHLSSDILLQIQNIYVIVRVMMHIS